MDEVDRAQAQMEMMEQLIPRRVQDNAPCATGVCLWCGAPVAEGRRWCDADCRDDWEYDHARRR